MKLIDSHVHFLDPQRLTYDWLDRVPDLRRPALPSDFDLAVGEIPVDGMIFMEVCARSEQSHEEIRWVRSLAKSEPRLLGLVPRVLLADSASHASLLALVKGEVPVVGVRDVIQWERPGYCRTPAYMEGARKMGEAGLVVDLCLFHHQLPDACRLVEACPDVQFVLDHAGKPAIKAREIDPWRTHLAELAAHPKVVCKLSGLLTEADWTHWKAPDFHPYLDEVVRAFGADRLLFGGDWPVCSLAGSYADWFRIVQELTRDWSASDRQAFFADNATRIYHLPKL